MEHDVRRVDTAMARTVGEDLVILNPQTGEYYGLNVVGSLIWERHDTDCPRDELVAAVVADYDVEPREASTDVDELIEQLHAAELISP
jgi:predicted Rdx family selenoprotein